MNLSPTPNKIKQTSNNTSISKTFIAHHFTHKWALNLIAVHIILSLLFLLLFAQIGVTRESKKNFSWVDGREHY